MATAMEGGREAEMTGTSPFEKQAPANAARGWNIKHFSWQLWGCMKYGGCSWCEHRVKTSGVQGKGYDELVTVKSWDFSEFVGFFQPAKRFFYRSSSYRQVFIRTWKHPQHVWQTTAFMLSDFPHCSGAQEEVYLHSQIESKRAPLHKPYNCHRACSNLLICAPKNQMRVLYNIASCFMYLLPFLTFLSMQQDIYSTCQLGYYFADTDNNSLAIKRSHRAKPSVCLSVYTTRAGSLSWRRGRLSCFRDVLWQW